MQINVFLFEETTVATSKTLHFFSFTKLFLNKGYDKTETTM
jgi:hypothetical protein